MTSDETTEPDKPAAKGKKGAFSKLMSFRGNKSPKSSPKMSPKVKKKGKVYKSKGVISNDERLAVMSKVNHFCQCFRFLGDHGCAAILKAVTGTINCILLRVPYT